MSKFLFKKLGTEGQTESRGTTLRGIKRVSLGEKIRGDGGVDQKTLRSFKEELLRGEGEREYFRRGVSFQRPLSEKYWKMGQSPTIVDQQRRKFIFSMKWYRGADGGKGEGN